MPVFGLASNGLGQQVTQTGVQITEPATVVTREEVRPRDHLLDNVEGPWINLNVVPIRPMAQTGDHAHIYAVNTHASLVQHYGNLAGPPTDSFRVPWGPVSIAIWPDFAETELLVVCRGSHVLARLDRLTGETLAILDLPFEPADIIVDHTRARAFISCSGDDSVVEVDLLTNTIAQTYAIPSKHPVFLSFDANGTDVLVAPMFSGNNSLVAKDGTSIKALGNVLDLSTSASALDELPDEDLFRIDPVGLTVEPVLRGTGTVLFAHGINPVTGQFWQLNTEANNKDATKQTEESIRGESVVNRLTISTLPVAGFGVNATHVAMQDLDDTDALTSGVQYDPARTIGQPYGLTFDSAGNALITGLLTDNVTALSPSGAFLSELDLADGSIPRQTLFWGPTTILVYCWGTNRVEMWNAGRPWSLLAALDLGADPAPAIVQEGRAIFYDASNSLHNNQSCASCHVEGRTDMAVWNLSNATLDSKGPMVTQTLSGIDKTPPFHWRGERASLADFNAAFPELLGGPPLGTTPDADGITEFEKFEAFVFSIQAPANPNQHPRRIVSNDYGIDAPSGMPQGSAIRGRDLFLNAPTDGGLTCNFCHTLPNGTSNDTTADAPDDGISKRVSFEVTAFTEMWRKEQPQTTIELTGTGVQDYPVLGAGLTHAGVSNGVVGFVEQLFDLTDQEIMDIAAFVNTVDQGLAPYVHHAELLNQSTLPASESSLTVMLQQARRRNIDIAVYGTVDLGAGPVPMAWAWDRQTQAFLPEQSSVGPRPLGFFLAQATAGTGNVVFVGLPVGMGRPWGTDFDDDQLPNLDEIAYGASAVDADSDDDGVPDGQEVLYGGDPASDLAQPLDPFPPVIRNLRVKWVTTKVAKVMWETDEPTTYLIDYYTTQGPSQRASGNQPKTVHSAILGNLLGSTRGGPVFVYQATLSALDHAGNKTDVAVPSFTTGFLNARPGEAVLANLQWSQLLHETSQVQRGLGPVQIDQLNGRAQVRVRSKTGQSAGLRGRRAPVRQRREEHELQQRQPDLVHRVRRSARFRRTVRDLGPDRPERPGRAPLPPAGLGRRRYGPARHRGRRADRQRVVQRQRAGLR